LRSGWREIAGKWKRNNITATFVWKNIDWQYDVDEAETMRISKNLDSALRIKVKISVVQKIE
jgi:hypothetical protein